MDSHYLSCSRSSVNSNDIFRNENYSLEGGGSACLFLKNIDIHFLQRPQSLIIVHHTSKCMHACTRTLHGCMQYGTQPECVPTWAIGMRIDHGVPRFSHLFGVKSKVVAACNIMYGLVESMSSLQADLRSMHHSTVHGRLPELHCMRIACSDCTCTTNHSP